MALVLSRRNMQTVVFPSLGITITVAEIRKGKTKLAIDAPRDVKVLRGELSEKEIEELYDDGVNGPGND